MRELSYAQALNEALKQCMAEDERVILLGEDVGVYGGIFQVSAGLLGEFGPSRVIDTPISEAGFVGAGVGAALTGMRPVVEIMFIDFTTCAMDMIINQMAKMHYMFGGRAGFPWCSEPTSGPVVEQGPSTPRVFTRCLPTRRARGGGSRNPL